MYPKDLDQSLVTLSMLNLQSSHYAGGQNEPLVLGDYTGEVDKNWENFPLIFRDLHREFDLDWRPDAQGPWVDDNGEPMRAHPGKGYRFSGNGSQIEREVDDLLFRRSRGTQSIPVSTPIKILTSDYLQGMFTLPRHFLTFKFLSLQNQYPDNNLVIKMPLDKMQTHITFVGNDNEPSLVMRGHIVGKVRIQIIADDKQAIKTFCQLFQVNEKFIKEFCQEQGGSFIFEEPIGFDFTIKCTETKKTLEDIRPMTTLSEMFINNKKYNLSKELVLKNRLAMAQQAPAQIQPVAIDHSKIKPTIPVLQSVADIEKAKNIMQSLGPVAYDDELSNDDYTWNGFIKPSNGSESSSDVSVNDFIKPSNESELSSEDSEYSESLSSSDESLDALYPQEESGSYLGLNVLPVPSRDDEETKTQFIEFMREVVCSTSGSRWCCFKVNGKKQSLEDLIDHIENTRLQKEDIINWMRAFLYLGAVRQKYGSGLRGQTATVQKARQLINGNKYDKLVSEIFGESLKTYSYDDIIDFAVHGQQNTTDANQGKLDKSAFSASHKKQFLQLYEGFSNNNNGNANSLNSEALLEQLGNLRNSATVNRRKIS